MFALVFLTKMPKLFVLHILFLLYLFRLLLLFDVFGGESSNKLWICEWATTSSAKNLYIQWNHIFTIYLFFSFIGIFSFMSHE